MEKASSKGKVMNQSKPLAVWQGIQPLYLIAPSFLLYNCSDISNRDKKEVKEATPVEGSIEIQEVVYNDLVCDTSGNTLHVWHASLQNI